MGDIDAININNMLSNKSLPDVFKAYYSNDVKDRYKLFYEHVSPNNRREIVEKAKQYLSPGILTEAFKAVFKSQYDKDMINQVAIGFATHIYLNQ